MSSLDCRALLVDDEEGIRDYLEYILSSYGMSVKTCSSAREALQEYKENFSSYDMLISDMKMPDMDGVALLKAIREDQEIKQPYFILLTGGVNVDLENCEDELVKRIDGYLYKPFDEEQIFAMISDTLGRKPKVDAA